MNIDKSVLKVPLYPFLIALAPVVNLFVLNRLQLESLDIVRPAIVYLIVAAVAVSLSRLFCRSGRGAALLGCLIVLSLVGYGFAFYLVHNALNITTPPTFSCRHGSCLPGCCTSSSRSLFDARNLRF